MRKLKSIYRKLVPTLAVLFVVIIAAVVFRAWSIVKSAGTEGIEQGNPSFLESVWMELKALFTFSRFS